MSDMTEKLIALVEQMGKDIKAIKESLGVELITTPTEETTPVDTTESTQDQ